LLARTEFVALHRYRGDWFHDPTSPSPFGPALWSSRSSVAGGRFNFHRAPLIEFRRPARSCTDDTGRHPFDADSFFGLRFPMTHAVCEVRFTRALPTRHLPSSGFDHPLDGFLPRQPGRTCFSSAASRNLPFEAFSLLGVERSYDRLRPACRDRRPPRDETDVSPCGGWRLGYRVPHRASPLRPRSCLTIAAAGCSLGLSPFQGSPSIALKASSGHLLPCASLTSRSPAAPTYASEFRSATDLLGRLGPAPLLGFYASTSLAPSRWLIRAMGSPCE